MEQNNPKITAIQTEITAIQTEITAVETKITAIETEIAAIKIKTAAVEIEIIAIQPKAAAVESLLGKPFSEWPQEEKTRYGDEEKEAKMELRKENQTLADKEKSLRKREEQLGELLNIKEKAKETQGISLKLIVTLETIKKEINDRLIAENKKLKEELQNQGISSI